MKKFAFYLILVLMILSGCCKKAQFPPVIRLERYEPIAMINVEMTNAEGNLSGLATQRLIEFMTEEQKGIRIIEIGSLKDVLSEVKKSELNSDALKAVGEKYKVKAVIMGEIYISDVKPQVDFNLGFPYISAKAKISSEMTVRMYDTDFGATVWTASSWAKDEVGNLSIFKDHVSFNAQNPEDAYGDLVNALIRWSTLDFRSTYKCIKD